MQRSTTQLRSCASESNLVFLGKRAEQEALLARQHDLYKKRLRALSLEEKEAEGEAERKTNAKKAGNMRTSLLTALVLACLAWSLGLHFDGEDEFQRALDTLDTVCPPLTRRADNQTVTLMPFDFKGFQGDWHKVAWLREPDRDDMRCRFVTDSAEARNLQHLEQISPADYSNKGYHFLLNRVSKLWVVDTDYDNWAMLYTCSPHFGTTTQQAFIVSRKSTLDIVTMGEVLTKWSEYNVPWKDFKIKEQQHHCTAQ
mmetsp:Transcript_11703/g.30289  ORF Transcript_11703/g.30289 Transcript_11703/m.30289 type:complete len:256 (+) Transcript_11703:131-898(+)